MLKSSSSGSPMSLLDLSDGVGPHVDQAVPKPPPPLNLDDVYRPHEDPYLRPACAADKPLGDVPVAADMLFGIAPAVSSRTTMQVDLLGLGGDQQTRLAPSCSWQSREAPQEAPTLTVTPKRGVIDLSSTPLFEDRHDVPPQVTPTASSQALRRPGQSATVDSSQSRPIPRDSRGFGSDDLFGNGSQEKSIQETFQTEATKAYSSAFGLLPEQVRTQIPSCAVPPNTDDETEITVAPPQPEHQHAPSIGAGGALEVEHTRRAVDRVAQGRWVPTYMRQQLAENGHTSLPSAPHAHESPAAEPPAASLGDAFADLGTELGDSAQRMFTFVFAMLSSLSLQCQLCTHMTASSMHEQIISYGENFWGDGETEVLEPPSEATAGYGPVRSGVQHLVPGTSFEQFTRVVRTLLVSPRLPQLLTQAVSSRTLVKSSVVHLPPVENWIFRTDVNIDSVPPILLERLTRTPGNAMQKRQLICREVWHVELQDQRASVEITTEPSGGEAILVMRLELCGLDANRACQVDSRVYARSAEYGVPLPLGLVEHLVAVHRTYMDGLCGTMTALCSEQGSMSGSSMLAASDVAVPQTGRRTDSTVASCADSGQPTAGGAGGVAASESEISVSDPVRQHDVNSAEPSSLKLAAGSGQVSMGLETAFLLKVADGI